MAAALANDSPKYRNSLICCSPRTAEVASGSPSSSSTSGCVSADESYDSNIPKSIANKKLKIHSSATREEIEKAIIQCKELVLSSPQCSEERKWLVRYLIELRIRLEDLKDNDGQNRQQVAIKGHHFERQISPSNRKQYCDHCSGVIWSIVQASYICNDCGYLCHYKCVDDICRMCAHVVMTDKGQFEMTICPEKGLAAQNYKCAECHTALTFKDTWNDPRLCDYTGLYFCTTCHWNDLSAIPARVVHNWDWEKRYISRLAFQMLTLSWSRPYIDVERINSKLFKFIAELEWVHKMRKDLEWMRRYLCACPEGTLLLSPLFVQLGDVNNKYSMAHLQAINDGSLESELTELTELCRAHITNCALCSGKGYICEICSNNEVIYPFDNGAIMCEKCNSVYHRCCWLRKGQKCLKCVRLEERKKSKVEDVTDSNPEFDIDKFVE
ncbi:differentially expressed in FDCP 8 homolog [Plodia interpunctella]|uniref:differentially expressed in FDCP 8 homolog n=1 Tax=Plodia interpunctella TaxID=58824 RepID=UPI002367F8A6|nr:differentially expressed in FDCP 8 homolog [Plodia interpunctella]